MVTYLFQHTYTSHMKKTQICHLMAGHITVGFAIFLKYSSVYLSGMPKRTSTWSIVISEGGSRSTRQKVNGGAGVAVLGMQLVRTFIIRTVVSERNTSQRGKYGNTLELGRQNWIYWCWCILELCGCFIYTHNKKFLLVA